MSSDQWLLDSNVVMGYLNQDPSPGLAERIERMFGDGSAISVITYIEVLGWPGHTEASRRDAQSLLRSLTLIELSPAVAEKTIELRSQHAIKLPDAVIAATAFVAELCLVTRNVQDFERINGLRIVDPYAVISASS